MNYLTNPELIEEMKKFTKLSWDLPSPEEEFNAGNVILHNKTESPALLVGIWEKMKGITFYLIIPISPEPSPLHSREIVSPVDSPFDGALELWNMRVLDDVDISENFIPLLPDNPVSRLDVIYEGCVRTLTGESLPDGLENGEAIKDEDGYAFEHQEEEASKWNKINL